MSAAKDAQAILAYDFGAHGWDRGGTMNPACVKEAVEMLTALVADPEVYEATTDRGSSSRCGWGDVLGVELRDDGSRDARVMPRFLLRSWSGNAYWEPWFLLAAIRRKGAPR